MKQIRLDSRLAAAAKYATFGGVAADIGTDHAFLPCYLIQSGICRRALACDIRQGPLDKAKQTVDEYGFNDKVRLILCDGLCGIDDNDKTEITDIIIAGMGGEMIAKILADSHWVQNDRYNLIFQPMTKAHTLRKYLCDNGYIITDETACIAANKHYAVINARYCGKPQQYDLSYLYAGALLSKTDDDSCEYKRMIANKLLAAAKGMQSGGQAADKAKQYTQCANELLHGVK